MIQRLQTTALSLSILALATAASAQNSPNNNQPITQADILVSNGGDVTAQITAFAFNGWPAYNNLAYYVPSGSTGIAQDTFVGQNHDFQTNVAPVDLGSIGLGSEVKLGLGTNYNGSTFDNFWFTGAGSRNADGQIHAYMQTINANTVKVDFEDLPNGSSDWNYGDASITVTGVHTQAVPEPTSIAVLGLGALGLLRRRKQK